MRTILRMLGAALIAGALGCGGGGDSPAGVTSPGGTTGGINNGGGGGVSTNAVTVSDNQFSPSAINVSVGSTVTWTWSSASSTHNVTFADGTGSGDRSAGATFSKSFSTAGTFAFQCTIHPGMSGTVKVQ